MTDLSTYFQNGVSGIEASVFNNWGVLIESVRDETVVARNEAVAAAEQAAAPADDQIATLVADAGSATRGQLDGRYATSAALTALQASAASIEDLFASTIIVPLDASISVTRSFPVLIAPFPLTVTSIALSKWEGTTIATSDTNWWLVQARTANAAGTAQTVFGTKTTRVTASGGNPAGTAIANRAPWTFDTSLLTSPNLAAGETANIAFTTNGTPAAITGPVLVTVGYRPL
jgi:hypothetical protein